jgi:hypothetical protein
MVAAPRCVTLDTMPETFAFDFDPRYRPLLAVGGITPARSRKPPIRF